MVRDTIMTTLHCDEFYCSTCKQIYPSHLGIPRYGHIDCPWCHDCVKDDVACSICLSVPKWDKVSMPVKRVCKVKMDLLESIVGEPLKYSMVELLVQTTTALLEPYRKKAIQVWAAHRSSTAIILETHTFTETQSLTPSLTPSLTQSLTQPKSEPAIPSPLDMEAPVLDCFPPGLPAPLAKGRSIV